MIKAVYSAEPRFSATDQHPDAIRKTWVGATRTWTVDYTGAEPTSEEIRLMVEPTAEEIAAKKAEAEVLAARALMTDKSPASRANRVMARIITKRFGDVIDTMNVLIARENARGGTPITPLTKTPWPQLLAAVRAGIANETDPES